MRPSLHKCTHEEWAQNSMQMYSKTVSPSNYLAANTLSCLQFLPEDQDQVKAQSYCLKNEAGESLAWMNIYFISKNVLRIRGLFVRPDSRGNGLMSQLLNEVLKIYTNQAKKVISFSRLQTVNFHKKNLFQLEKKFTARTMVLYNPYSKEYYHDPDGEVVLMYRKL